MFEVNVLAELIVKKIKENGCDFEVRDINQNPNGICIDVRGLNRNFWVVVKEVK